MDYLCTIVTTYPTVRKDEKPRQTVQHVTCPSRFAARRMVDVLNASGCDLEAVLSVRFYRQNGPVILSADDVDMLLNDWTDDRQGGRSSGKPSFIDLATRVMNMNGHWTRRARRSVT